MKKQVELSITHNGKDVVAYPYTKKEHVQFENGMNIDEFVGQDIATPTITHDTTAIKVGVGDSDVSSSVVDSAVGKMVIKGQTYQNILPEPSTYVLSNDKEMFKVNEGLDENVEIVDSVAKGAVLKGRTLVNLVDIIGGGVDTTLTTDSSKQAIKATSNGKAWSQVYVYLKFHKPNTHYLVTWDSIEGALHSGYVGCYANDDNVALDNDLGLPRLSNKNYSTSNYIVFNTKEYRHNTDFALRFHLNGTNENINGDLSIEIKGLRVFEYQEGMENWNTTYIEGMASCKMPVLQTHDGNIMRLSPPQHTTNNVTIEKINDVEFLFNQGSRQGMGGWKWSIPNGEAFTLSFDYEKVSGCENQCQINVACAGGIADKTDLSEQFGQFEKTYYVRRTTPTVVEFKPVGELTSTKSVLKISNLKWYIGNKVYSDKTNILHTPEEVVLKGLGDVQDTLNVNTGEYVQRVKEVIYTGEEDGWSSSQMLETPKNISFYIPLDNHLDNTNNPTMRELVKDSLGFTNNCRSATVNEPSLDGKKGFSIHNNGNVYFTIPTSECTNLDAWKSRLRTQPLVLQYPVKNPIIKTVDLSSSGNWEKIVYNGEQNWYINSTWSSGDILACHTDTVENKLIGGLAYGSSLQGMNYSEGCVVNNVASKECVKYDSGSAVLYILIKKSRLPSPDANGLKQYLSQNPETIWYQTATHQDSTKVKQPIFFKDGHIIQSSGTDNSLIPTLDYQAKTSNSYVMDLMKANTRYTMKAKSASGTFTIDGTSYGAGTNGTFTTPSSMTNKFLVMSNKTNEEVMVLEGDLTSKTIPYFKGIKSAFEDEGKIEVLSTGKNLFDIDKYALDNNLTRVGEDGLYINRVSTNLGTVDIQYKKKTQYVVGYQSYELLTTNDDWTPTIQFKYSDGTQEQLYLHVDNRKVSNVNKDVVEINIQNPWANVTANVYGIYVEEFPSDTTYEPHKSNTTKIPLLHPLRSLPNGVCDELIIDRLNHKAKLIQRVGCSQLKGNAWTHRHAYSDRSKDFSFFEARNVNHFKKPNFGMISPQFPTYQLSAEHLYNETRSYIWCGNTAGEYPYAWIETSKLATDDVAGVKRYFDSHPLDLHHELATPIITEIDLEGYPYAYKDGHIFLNSDIAPTTEITYSINQAQQIESANENLQRHEKEISHLQKLIAQYIQVEYESTLLSLKI